MRQSSSIAHQITKTSLYLARQPFERTRRCLLKPEAFTKLYTKQTKSAFEIKYRPQEKQTPRARSVFLVAASLKIAQAAKQLS